MNIYRFRILKALFDNGNLLRWQITRIALPHVKQKSRNAIIKSLINDELITQEPVRKKTGAGAPAMLFKLTELGMRAYRLEDDRNPGNLHIVRTADVDR